MHYFVWKLKFLYVNIVNYQVLTNLCPPFEYCSIFTSLATCSFLNSPINFKWLDVLCRLSFSVCCSSLQNGYCLSPTLPLNKVEDFWLSHWKSQTKRWLHQTNWLCSWDLDRRTFFSTNLEPLPNWRTKNQ
jgi:hypothetical protein